MAVVAEHTRQRRVEQMRRGMRAADGIAAFGVDGNGALVAQLDRAGNDLAIVHELAALVLLNIRDLKHAVRAGNYAVVGHLTAHLGVHRRLVEHHDSFDALGDFRSLLVLGHHCKDLALRHVVFIADKFGGRDVLTKLDTGPAEVAQRLARLSGANLLLLHLALEFLLVDLHSLFLRHLDRQVDREAIGVVKLEGVRAGEHRFSLFLMGGQHFRKNAHTAVDGLGEILLLHAHHAGDIGRALAQIGIMSLIFMDDRFHDLAQEGMVHTQQLAVARRAAQQAAQNVAAALVGGQHTVRDHKDGSANMVGDDAQGNVALLALAVACAGQLRHLVGNVHHGIDVEQGIHVLADDRQTLQSHAGVDILLHELGVVAVAVIVELGEHVVPDLHIAVAVAADRAAGFAAAVLLAAVIVDLGAGAARAGAMLPEVVLLAEAEDTVGRDADLLVPDLKSLVVVLID